MENFFKKPKLSEPNEMGFQFGINESLTDYAHKKQWQTATTFLPPINVTVMEVWKDDKLVTYLLVDDKTNEPIDEAQGFDAAACALDKHKFLAMQED